jgi:hypothetical protein
MAAQDFRLSEIKRVVNKSRISFIEIDKITLFYHFYQFLWIATQTSFARNDVEKNCIAPISSAHNDIRNKFVLQ